MTPFSMAGSLRDAIAAAQTASRAGTWPDTRWQGDIVGFCEHYFGLQPWSRQADVLRAIQNGDRVAVASGHKIGKSFLVAVAALWFYASHPDARVILMASTFRQVEWIIWREVRRLWKLARRRGTPLDGELREVASSGLRADDEREIRGFTADRAEDAAGISGPAMLFVFDEATGIQDRIWEAMSGNMAGGVKVVAISNPTANDGWFAGCFTGGAKQFWTTFQISSEETPNVKTGKRIVPGLATREWVLERRAEWGEDSTIYKVRVKGEFAIGEDSKICSLDVITRASKRIQPEEGPLVIGLDPAEKRDTSAFVAVRGKRMIRSWTFEGGLSPDAHAVQLAAIIAELRKPNEEPTVTVDREGAVGNAVYGTLRIHAETNHYRLVGVRSSDKARDFKIYGRIRDELWANLARWLRDGSIPPDVKLQKELHSADWAQIDGVMKATQKEKIRQLLGHSPDIADALALAVWSPSEWQYAPAPDETSLDPYPEERIPTMDPYSALDAFRQ